MSTSVKDDVRLFLQDPRRFAEGVDEQQRRLWAEGLSRFGETQGCGGAVFQLRPSQVAAWRGLIDQRTGLVLGPPGTGKTFFGACLAVGQIAISRGAGLPFRVMVTGFTLESISNLVDRIAELAAAHLPGVPCAFFGNTPRSGLSGRVLKCKMRTQAERDEAWQLLLSNEHCVVAVTNWGLARLLRGRKDFNCDGHTAHIFDLVLIDEASQMLVGQGLMSLAGLNDAGRVVVAGDDRQLEPVRNTFQTEVEGGRQVGSSLYSFLKSAGVKEFPLEETFRLNAPLIAFPSEKIYTSPYISLVPERRLALSPTWRCGLNQWEEEALDPEHPVVIIVHEGPTATTESPFERHHIRRLVALLADRMMPSEDSDELDGDTFWGDRLAVITPFRLQNAALREELSPVRFGRGAFVDTVDRIQGRERDAVIAGYVASDAEYAASISEFLYSPERLNVMVTRPRSKLILFVSRRLLEVIPATDESFDNANLLREFIYESECLSEVGLMGPDAHSYPAEIRVRPFTVSSTATCQVADDAPTPSLATPRGGADTVRVTRLTYAGESLSNERIWDELGLGAIQSYAYVVATAALARLRSGICPPQQRRDDQTHLRFDQVVRLMLPRPVLTRTEERVVLSRAIKNAFSDRRVRDQVRHDIFPWLGALAALAEEGIDLTAGVDDETSARFVSESVRDVLTHLQGEVKRLLSADRRRPFEESAYTFLGDNFEVQPLVVMEGFTFLTPLQRRFVQSYLNGGSSVVFVHPFATDQERGFQALTRTYSEYAERSELITVPAPPLPPDPTSLQFLRRSLFRPTAVRPAPLNDGTVTIDVYAHRHDEVAACFQKIRSYITGGQYRADEIAIIARNPSEFDTLLQEQAQLQQLPTVLRLPPRLLLLTPIGRFALTLYEVMRDGAFRMAPDQFETILASGWLGQFTQETTGIFTGVREQFFARCETLGDWRGALEQLRQVHDRRGTMDRLPTALVSESTIDRWENALDQIQRLGHQLFGAGARSIGRHIRLLLDELAALDPGNIRRTEREIIERIREVLEQVSESQGMEVTGEEFGDVLSSLVKEYQLNSDSLSEAPNSGEVWVASPEGFDSYAIEDQSPGSNLRRVKVVFYLGLDDRRVPRRAPDPWPFFEDDLGAPQELERYLFLAVARAAGDRLHLSYAKRGEGETYRPSLYLEEVARAADLPIPTAPGNRVAPAILTVDAAGTEPGHRLNSITRNRYYLHEVAQFGLCPYRYKLERLDTNSRVCRDQFHLELEAQGVWLDLVLDRSVGAELQTYGELSDLLLRGMDGARPEVRRLFNGFREIQWREVEDRVRRALDEEARYLTKNNYPVSLRNPAPTVGFDVPGPSGRTLRVETGLKVVAFTGVIPRPLLKHLTLREWLLPALRTEDTTAPARVNFSGFRLFANLYHAHQWWGGVIRYATTAILAPAYSDAQSYAALQEEAQVLIRHIEEGHYPKKPGDHCTVCPVRDLCLRIPE